jgi:hypothetical protein
MSALRIAAISILAVILVALASVLGWRALRTGVVPPKSPPPAQQMNAPPQQQSSLAPTIAPAGPAANRLGPFSIAGQDYFVELQTRKVRPGAADQQGDTVVAMEIRDAAGVVQYRRTFPYVEATENDLESWSVSALRLTGTNGTGLLVAYDVYSEPSAPEEESTGWFQVFGVVDKKFAPFGAPLQIQGGLLEKYSDGHTYRSARPLDTQSDAVEFKAWTGHCRVMYPVRVDWAQGKLTPAQQCSKNAGESGAGCQYEVLPEDKLNSQGITFVRLWPAPDEKSGQPVKAVVKQGAKVDLLTARVAMGSVESGTTASAPGSKGPLGDVVSIGVAPDADLWLKVRIDGKEGWMHSEEDFLALGLPEDE